MSSVNHNSNTQSLLPNSADENQSKVNQRFVGVLGAMIILALASVVAYLALADDEPVVSPLTATDLILLTGENSVVEIHDETLGQTLCSHWRAVYSTAGPGHALFCESAQITGDEVWVYSDNDDLVALLRELETEMRPQFGNESLPIISATFDRSADLDPTNYSEWVTADNGDVMTLKWEQSDQIDPFMLTFAVGAVWDHLGVYCNIIPTQMASLSFFDKETGQKTTAYGRVIEADMGGEVSTSSFLAWGESWLKKRN